jgi:hypothetical protein
MKAYKGSGDVAPLILNLRTIPWRVFNCTCRPLYTLKKILELLNSRLCGPRKLLDGFGEATICCPYGIRSLDRLAPSRPQKNLKYVILFFWDKTPSPWAMESRIFEAKLFFHLQG